MQYPKVRRSCAPASPDRPRSISPLRGRARLVQLVSSLLVVAGSASATIPRASASVGTDKTKLAQLQQQIAADGLRAQSLVERYDATAAKLDLIKAQIASDNVSLLKDRRAEQSARQRVGTAAVNAYVDAGSGSAIITPGSVNGVSLPARQVYLGVATGALSTAVTEMETAQRKIAVTKVVLHSAEVATANELSQLSVAQSAARQAIGAAQTLASSVNSNLLVLIAQQQAARQRAAEQRAEEALAQQEAQQAANAPPTTVAPNQIAPQPIVPTPTTSSGSYSNPFRAVAGLSPERIDQGVDFSGSGPIYAIGEGVVLSTYNGGWPGGTYITYRLTNGPAAGLVVYAAEDIMPSVQVGETVSANTVIGQMFEGPDGIETGWANGSGDGQTMASATAQFGGGNSTAYGANFSQLLASLGSPSGILQNSPASGALSPSWPNW